MGVYMMRSGRASLIVKMGRLLQRLPLSWLRFLEAPFLARQRNSDVCPPMLFVMGVPRSGSTLTYQVIIHALECSYLSNLANLLYQLPLVGGVLSARLCKGYSSDFESNHGYVAGLCGPAEGLKYWSYWLDYGLDERGRSRKAQSAQHKRYTYLRRVLARLSKRDAPFVSGYLGHALNPSRLQQEFPGSVYIHLRRDMLSTASSLLRARRKSGGGWLSVFPQECENALGMGEHAEVAAQVYWLSRRLEEDLKGDDVFVLDYESLCENPNREIEKLVRFCGKRGIHLSVKKSLPAVFMYKVTDSHSDEDARILDVELRKLEATHGKLQRYSGSE